MPSQRSSYQVLVPLLIALIVPALLSAQEHSYSHYDAKSGLAGSTVYSMAEDKDGFVWFGTETGLSRFDGTRFQNFTTGDGLPDNEIVKVQVDARNRVWIMPFSNSLAYYWRGKIYNQKNDSLLRRLKLTSEARSVLLDKDGDLLILEQNRMHLIDTSGRITDVDRIRNKPFQLTAWGVDPAGKFQIVLIDIPTTRFYYISFEGHTLRDNKEYFPGLVSYYIYYTSPDLEVHYTDGQLHFINLVANTDLLLPMPKGFLNVTRLNDSITTVQTYHGVYFVDTKREMMVDSFLTTRTVSAAMTDREGNTWFSTIGNGVYRLASGDFMNYTFTDQDNELPVCSIRRFDSTLYVGTEHFLVWKIGPGDHKAGKLKLDEGRSRGRIVSITGAPAGNILFATDNGVVISKNGKLTSRSVELPVKSIQVVDSAVIAFTGVYSFWLCLPDLKMSDTVFTDRTTGGYKKDGLYYLGTLGGLRIIDEQKRVVPIADSSPVLKSRINDIKEGADGTLWIATNGEGLVGYRDKRVIVNIRDTNGLTSNVCRSIFLSGKELWVGTDKGVNRIIQPLSAQRQILPITSLDGLASDIVNTVYTEGNLVFVGTDLGMTAFNQNQLTHRSECILKMTGITVEGKPWAADTSNFIVPHIEDDLQFDFVGISYKSAGNITYKYRLTGLYDDWRTTNHTTLNYLSLPSGNYELEIQATNKFGISSEVVRVRFVIDKLFWERTWFRMAVLLLLAGLIWMVFSIRIRRIRKKEQERSDTVARMAELEHMALRSQMNPHFIFNSLNSIQKYVLDKDVISVNEYITRFSRLIRQTLDFSSRPHVSLKEEIDYLTTYLQLEKTRFEDRFVYEICIPEDLPDQDIQIPPMILQPYVENAIRHGVGLRNDNEGKVGIKITLRGEYLACVVSDNGVGRLAAARAKGRNPIQYQSQGMKLTEKRIAMFNKAGRSPVQVRIEDLEDGHGKAAGTRITVLFPLGDMT